ncbi:hypothetical protein CWB96_01045 [Pseudoalteromonas citrea]|uniref:Uncharacterized protein n=1 Tax=Pseudoalteromonas citrea TaxID=43655 RepID=A0A5S3XWK4_9GAMM|nr:hypothetical protein [Pseudoalteromonas citrea]TMP41634.1 hypothetical protein CWB97_13890 [Pseudoalteromonas citrea]TMP62534.1 hypothetical protein CWB96_01045 [Pseudoalteromonas citrea]
MMQVLDSYSDIEHMISALEQQVKDNELDAAQEQLQVLDKALNFFCEKYLIESSGPAFEAVVKLNERLSGFIIKLEVTKKETAEALIGQVSKRKKISAYRNT